MACAGVWSKRFSSCFGAFAITKVICKKYINVGTKMKIVLEKIKKKYLKKEVLKDILEFWEATVAENPLF